MRAPYLDDGDVRLYLGDCIKVMGEMPAESVHAIVCDPPYALPGGFMGKEWDRYAPPQFAAWCETWAREALRVLKPGGHLLAFGGTRTFHRLTCGIEDAGFEVRDCLSWLYGSGFPKSLDVSKAIDKARDDRADVLRVTAEVRRLRDAAGLTNRDLDELFGFAGMAGHWTSTASQPAVPTVEQWGVIRDVLNPPEWLEREVWRLNGRKARPITGKHDAPAHAQQWKANYGLPADLTPKEQRDVPATDAAREWQGWGTALKPGYEPAVVARKPHTPQTELAAEAARAQEELCAVASYAETVTSWSELLRTSGFWSTASSLLACLADLSERASTFTTETASSLTTDLAIWRSSLSPITRACITRDPTPPHGASSAAGIAAALSASVLLKCERLTATTAGETAIARPALPGLTQASALDNPSPAWEPCVVARKPLAGTVAANVQQHGTGALNIDGCRIGTVFGVDDSQLRTMRRAKRESGDGWGMSTVAGDEPQVVNPAGRWPANVALDDNAAAMLDAQSGERPSGSRSAGEYGGIGSGPLYGEGGTAALSAIDANTGGASRFYYTAKASRADRTTGGVANNTHPTVKPTDLMRWLVRMVTPPGGVVLDPFAGSGSTLVAARAEGFRAIGIEREDEYAEIIAQRLSQLSLFSEAP
jgi:hypothetical protein